MILNSTFNKISPFLHLTRFFKTNKNTPNSLTLKCKVNEANMSLVALNHILNPNPQCSTNNNNSKFNNNNFSLRCLRWCSFLTCSRWWHLSICLYNLECYFNNSRWLKVCLTKLISIKMFSLTQTLYLKWCSRCTCKFIKTIYFNFSKISTKSKWSDIFLKRSFEFNNWKCKTNF